MGRLSKFSIFSRKGVAHYVSEVVDCTYWLLGTNIVYVIFLNMRKNEKVKVIRPENLHNLK
jgi:hypothetical protein